MHLLRIENLHTHFDAQPEPLRAVSGVSLTLAPGRTLALVGESGCGKSLTALSTLRLLPPGARIAGGRVILGDLDLTALSDAALREIRGDRVSMIFQEPMTSLNPVLPIGWQVAEPLRLHRRRRGGSARNAIGASNAAARRRAIELLELVGIPDPARRAAAFPHELSGGMRQRAMIAMALACEPDVLIADEPTTALDVTIQAQILKLIREMQLRLDMAVLLITHDLAVVSQVADDVAVMYAGKIVESGPTAAVLASPLHPYTRGLLRCTPRLPNHGEPGCQRGSRLPVIEGEPPRLGMASACAFEPRCELGRGVEQCRNRTPLLEERLPGHHCACWKT
ncbi:MAG: ABC transporter ATP-binding protein [Phycisphaerae bacterium]